MKSLTIHGDSPDEPMKLIFCDNEGNALVLIDSATKEIYVDPDVEQAARAFWETVRKMAPEYFKEK